MARHLLAIAFLLTVIPHLTHASPLTDQVSALMQKLKLKPMSEPPAQNKELFRLGEALFFEKSISGNRNISCGSCHSPKHYSSDGLAIGIGEGASFDPTSLNTAHTLKRHTQHLINTGRAEIRHYFWDGRVSISADGSSFTTPEVALNGTAPALLNVADALSDSLAAQALFPLTDNKEMAGLPGSNEIANETTTPARWEKIVERFSEPQLSSRYQPLFNKAFPLVSFANINIGHVATAIAEFERHFFKSTNTPYDRFLKGDVNALDESSLKGFLVYASKGRCITCHLGEHLSNFQFDSSGSPQIGLAENLADFGRKDITNKNLDKFMFKTPTLRNVALTAPYMHSGSLKTLKDVVDHYNHIEKNLAEYVLAPEIIKFYGDAIVYDTDKERNAVRLVQVEGSPFIVGLGMTDAEKADLVHFLEVGLTDLDFKQRMDSYKEPK